MILRICRGGSRTAATSKVKVFVIIVNGFQPLTIITKRFILDAAAALDPPLAGQVCENKNTLINISSKHERKVPEEKILFFFLLPAYNY